MDNILDFCDHFSMIHAQTLSQVPTILIKHIFLYIYGGIERERERDHVSFEGLEVDLICSCLFEIFKLHLESGKY